MPLSTAPRTQEGCGGTAQTFNRLKSSMLDLSYAKDMAGDTPAPLRDRGGTVSDSSRRRSHEGAKPPQTPPCRGCSSHVTRHVYIRS